MMLRLTRTVPNGSPCGILMNRQYAMCLRNSTCLHNRTQDDRSKTRCGSRICMSCCLLRLLKEQARQYLDKLLSFQLKDTDNYSCRTRDLPEQEHDASLQRSSHISGSGSMSMTLCGRSASPLNRLSEHRLHDKDYSILKMLHLSRQYRSLW